MDKPLMTFTRATTTSTTISRDPRLTQKVPWGGHTRRILLLSFFAVIPMIAFAIAILAIVFKHGVDLNECPDPGLCPYTNGTAPANSSNYYINYSVGRIAFVSSLSSTISFALVPFMMSMFGYVVASQLLRDSKEPHGQISLPTPYVTSKLIRFLNTEAFPLVQTLFKICQRIIRPRPRVQQKLAKESRLLRLSGIVLFLSIAATIYIKIADTYLHIAIQSIGVTRLSLESQDENQLSRVLGPWMSDPSDPLGNKYFYTPALELKDSGPEVANISHYVGVSDDIQSYLFTYVDPEGNSYALLKPRDFDPSLDWTGTSYGVSNKCSAIRRDSCSFRSNATTLRTSSFNCTSSSPPIQVAGRFDIYSLELWTYGWHKYFSELPPFNDRRGGKSTTARLIDEGGDLHKSIQMNITREASNALYYNPWHSLAKVQVLAPNSELSDLYLKSPFFIDDSTGAGLILIACNTTVYDVTYTVINGQVSSLNTSKSEGAVAGIVSMLSLDTIGRMTQGKQRMMAQANANRSTPESLVRQYELSASIAMAVPLAAHSVPAPAVLVQRRRNAVITQLPKLALWLLIASNLLFALLGCILALLALKATSPEVNQVYIRLNTTGLAAQLFDPQSARRKGAGDTDLFRENHREEEGFLAKRVGVKRTAHGGAEFVVFDTGDETKMRDGSELTLRHTFTL